jgi:hypothetical protein
MRKVLYLGFVVAISLVFAFSSFAQEAEGEVGCTQCQKNCSLTDLPCVAETQQGRACNANGYALDWDCFSFPICDCPDTADYFNEGDYVGVRMSILTPGVYWATDPTELEIIAFKTISDSCDKLDAVDAGEGFISPDVDYVSSEFTNVMYFEDATCDPDDALVDPDGIRPFTDCTWDERDYPKSQFLSQNTGLDLFQIPEGWSGYKYWQIQIPNIRIDVDEIVELGLQGQAVEIKIEFIRPGTGSICQGDCQVICECTIKVATLCPDEVGNEAGGECVYFPYVITQYGNWATGIAISNLGNTTAENMIATFKLTDKTGKAFTYEKKDFETKCWSGVLDSMLNQGLFVGDGTPASGHAWLQIDTNFTVDGYQFVTDGVFGGSTLGRICGEEGSAF